MVLNQFTLLEDHSHFCLKNRLGKMWGKRGSNYGGRDRMKGNGGVLR